jgi:hypothetical protein
MTRTKIIDSEHWWLMPVILVIWEAGIRKMEVRPAWVKFSRDPISVNRWASWYMSVIPIIYS